MMMSNHNRINIARLNSGYSKPLLGLFEAETTVDKNIAVPGTDNGGISTTARTQVRNPNSHQIRRGSRRPFNKSMENSQ